MVALRCGCGGLASVGETDLKAEHACPECGAIIRVACAERLPEGAGEGDFDGYLALLAGPQGVGGRIMLGGCAEISLGRLAGSTIELPGTKVSRRHAKLMRIDFGPSRWKIADAGSSGGTFVNGQRIKEHELAPGDKVVIGEYQLEFGLAEAAVAPPPLPALAGTPDLAPPPLPSAGFPRTAQPRAARAKAAAGSGGIPWRVVVVLVGLGVGLGFFGYREMRLASQAKSEAQHITLAKLVAEGYGDNAYVEIADFAACLQAFVYSYSKDTKAWKQVYIPLVPLDSPWLAQAVAAEAAGRPIPPPTNLRVVARISSVHSEDQLQMWADQDTVRGLIVNAVDSLGREERRLLEESYPGSRFDSVLIFDDGRTPKGGSIIVLIFAGAALSILGGVGAAVWGLRR
jgi:hypothetical protein